MDNERIKYLEELLPEGSKTETKYWKKFEKGAVYLGNGVYGWNDIHATCTRELFLMGCLAYEGIQYKEV